MTLDERTELTLSFEAIYASAHQKISRLQVEKTEAGKERKTREDYAIHVAETRSVLSKAFNEILAQLKNVEAAELPMLTALYFHELSSLKYEVNALKKSRRSLFDLLGETRIRLQGKRIEERAVKNLLQFAKTKLRSAKLDRQKGASVKHKENRAMKAEVFLWLDAQPKFKSIEAAAKAITKQQPIAHVTGRDWYKEWKKLRSASTP